MGYVAKKLSEKRGVVELFQTSQTVDGQIEELHSVMNENCSSPVFLIGHSWGAWLSFMVSARHRDDVRKLILIGAGAFEEGTSVTELRMSRLSGVERIEAQRTLRLMNNSAQGGVDSSIFNRFQGLMSKTDSFDPIESEGENLRFQPEIFQSVWPEAERLRHDGRLLNFGGEICCPVVAIHGDYDPHPAGGVEEPLKAVLKNFRFILLKDCGHYPRKEKRGSENFFRVLHRELSTE
ncbi:MAG TPA: alpha/beta hydrolase [Candidatus Acidoferrales bacterium]|nr:alpha/beta hydrolase [Candidatus Acidoferrales bacterium]